MLFLFSEWAIKVPIFLIMGVSTAHDAPRKILSVNALQRLCACRFTLSSPAERMDAVLEAVFLKPCSGFTVSHKVALFMRSYFLCQDGTLTSFVRTLKVSSSILYAVLGFNLFRIANSLVFSWLYVLSSDSLSSAFLIRAFKHYA